MDWLNIKLALVQFTNLSMDALHLLGGVTTQILLALLLRRSLASPLPWLLVLGLECANEWFDLTHEVWPDRPMWPESFKDIVVTMLIPTAALCLVRWAPRLFRHYRNAGES